MKNPKALAFYLPQFHPIPENDLWWGAGFTEWANVVKSQPRFPGHHQPQLPADLGFYDLRLQETRSAQAALAKRYGIHGFCYYHYWFGGKRLLERPFNEVLSSGAPDFPFCLCWANESWTRAWDGQERQVLCRQQYSKQDHLHHITWLLDAFSDPRYIKVDGRPLVLVYRLQNIPDAADMTRLWRQQAHARGFSDLYICAVRSGFHEGSDENLLTYGIDAIVDFQPNSQDFPSAGVSRAALYRLAKKLLPDSVYQNIKLSASASNVIDYKKLVALKCSMSWPLEYVKLPCVFPSWDNSARRRTATIIQNNEPKLYQQWLEAATDQVARYRPSEQLVFINAWNEWAEGAHLEPDIRNGHAYLEATLAALSKVN